ncbi:hypothetical protein [Rhodococcoides fascians]|uniref:hypothetical protein n=1 Tax=Rhodococcoides fascians TaxID=1828 RepID=UPI001427B353
MATIAATNSDAVASDGGMSGHHHPSRSSMDVAAHTSSAGPAAGTWALLAIACVAGAALWMARKRLSTRFSQVSVDAALVVAAVSAVVVALLPSVRSAAEISHLAMMTQLMILVMIAPALASGFLRRWIKLSTRVVRLAAVPAALGYVFVMYLWHLPIVTVAGTSAAVLSAAALLVGLCLGARFCPTNAPISRKPGG